MSPPVLEPTPPLKTPSVNGKERAAGEGAVRRYSVPPLKLTPHPPWMEAMLSSLRREWDAACWPLLFSLTAEGKRPPLSQWQSVIAQYFFIVENFPKYMGLSLAKTTYGKRPGDASARRWLLQNLGVEARHAEWYVDWVGALGITPEELFALQPAPEVLALHEHLLETCTRGTLAEGVAATHWAIAGVTGVWTGMCEKPFREYAADGVRIDGVSMMWLKARGGYEEAHPEEALEIIKAAVDPSSDEPQRVREAARKSLLLLVRVWEACRE